ncbi:MAG: cysteine-rich CWC family protein [Bacteroidales bacterium]|nr:cysteine-rich CWC family protein [Bacteroidales bacterium]
MPENRNEETKKCPRCGAEFLCSSSSRCWCYEYDIPVEQLETLEREYNSCLCPECLKLYSRPS